MEQPTMFELTEEELRQMQIKEKRDHIAEVIMKTSLEIGKLEARIDEKKLMIESLQSMLEQLV